jgi:hypothetical protein
MIDTLPCTSSSPWAAVQPYHDNVSNPQPSRQGRSYVGHSYTWGEGFVVVASSVYESVSGSGFNEEFLAAARHVKRLLRLLPNWDSYGAKTIDRQRAETAIYLLWVAIASGVPTPAIVPTSDGGIQLEWHRCGVDLEIQVTSGTSLEVFFENISTGETYEDEIGVDLTPLRFLLNRVSC